MEKFIETLLSEYGVLVGCLVVALGYQTRRVILLEKLREADRAHERTNAVERAELWKSINNTLTEISTAIQFTNEYVRDSLLGRHHHGDE